MTEPNNRHTSGTDDWQTPDYILDPMRAWCGGTFDCDPATSELANERVKAVVAYDVIDNGFKQEWWGSVWLNPPGGVCDADGLRVVRNPPGQKAVPRKGKAPRPWCELSGACGMPAPHQHRGPIVSAAKAWWWQLAAEWGAGRTTVAGFLGFSIEILQTTQVDPPPGLVLPFGPEVFVCLPRTRIGFITPSGKKVSGNTHASVLVGLPNRNAKREDEWQRWQELLSPVGLCR